MSDEYDSAMEWVNGIDPADVRPVGTARVHHPRSRRRQCGGKVRELATLYAAPRRRTRSDPRDNGRTTDQPSGVPSAVPRARGTPVTADRPVTSPAQPDCRYGWCPYKACIICRKETSR